MEENYTEVILRLVEEVAEDNTALVSTSNRILETQTTLRIDLLRAMETLRTDFQGALAYRTLKDLCGELIMPLNAMEQVLEQADFSNPDLLRNHLTSLVITVNSVLSRMGADRIAISPGEDRFDPNLHLCVRLVPAADSPFPNVLPRTIVRIVEHGYTLAGKLLVPAKVEVQAEQ